MNQDPPADHVYETETMAELCARQGRLDEAIEIYRSLLDVAHDAPTRARFRARMATLEASWRPLADGSVPAADVPLPAAPGVSVHALDDQLTVAWALAPAVAAPTLELLLLQRTGAGIGTQKKTLPLSTTSGRLGLAAPALHSAVAAIGTMVDGRFVPLARSRRSS